jgi:hypothetical protein
LVTWCGSPFSISSSEFAFSITRLFPTIARPVPVTTKSHCSDLGCSFSTSSELLCPGLSVIIATCAERELVSTLK